MSPLNCIQVTRPGSGKSDTESDTESATGADTGAATGADTGAAKGAATCRLDQIELPSLADNQVRIRVDYSSINFKDAMATTGHPGVALVSPLVPGIDAVGEVLESNSEKFAIGDRVLVGHEDFGTRHHGGWCQQCIADIDWIVHLPSELPAEDAAALGTAGLTAAQSVWELKRHQVAPDQGPIAVTGATGGVGLVAIKILAKLGYEVVAVTGKQSLASRLQSYGASEVVEREQMIDDSARPLLAGRFAGAIDSVGGQLLASLIRATRRSGCVTACGHVGGIQLPLNIYPFILRGITLQGIDSAGLSPSQRETLWNRLAREWKLDGLQDLVNVVELEQAIPAAERLLASENSGRNVIRID